MALYISCNLQYIYSSLPNGRGAWNKRGGRKDGPCLISVVPGISVVVGISRPVIFLKGFVSMVNMCTKSNSTGI